MHKCINNSIGNVYHLEQFVSDFFPYSQKQLGFDKPVTIRFESDEKNSGVMLGKTAYYDPAGMEVVLYVDGRHPKDVMRSLSHELVHHAQNCRGDFTAQNNTGPGYAQSDPHLRKMEREAYTKGNLIFRDYEDLIKTGKKEVHIDFSKSGEPTMSLNEWKNKELNMLLMKKWGLLKEGAKPDFLDLDKDGDKEEPMKAASKEIGSKEHNDEEGNRPSMAKDMDLKEDSEGEETYHYGEDEGEDDKELHDLVRRHATKAHIDALKRDMAYDEDHEDRHERGTDFREGMFSPNHYCVHHGGVQHEGQIKMAEAINHNFDKKLNKVTWYDMKLQDGTILEQVAAGDIMVTNASMAEGHMHRVEDEDDLDEILAFGSEREKAWRRIARGSDDAARGPSRDKPAGHRDYEPSTPEEIAAAKKFKAAKKQEMEEASRPAPHGAEDRHFGDDADTYVGPALGHGMKGLPKGKKRHVAGGHPDVADFIMPNAPKGKAPPPGQRIMDPRHLKDKTTKVPPVKVREGKISVREAKEITRRIIERIKKESK